MSLTLNPDQLEALSEKIMQKICEANRNGSLTLLMVNMGWQELLHEACNANDNFHSYPTGKIIVLGGSEVKADKLLGVAKELGFDKSRFEFCLDYKDMVRYDYRSLQYQAQYRVILAGPIPHKTYGTGEYSSVISKMENNPGYPKVIRLTANQALKITKSNFKAALEELLDTGYLVA